MSKSRISITIDSDVLQQVDDYVKFIAVGKFKDNRAAFIQEILKTHTPKVDKIIG